MKANFVTYEWLKGSKLLLLFSVSTIYTQIFPLHFRSSSYTPSICCCTLRYTFLTSSYRFSDSSSCKVSAGVGTVSPANTAFSNEAEKPDNICTLLASAWAGKRPEDCVVREQLFRSCAGRGQPACRRWPTDRFGPARGPNECSHPSARGVSTCAARGWPGPSGPTRSGPARPGLRSLASSAHPAGRAPPDTSCVPLRMRSARRAHILACDLPHPLSRGAAPARAGGPSPSPCALQPFSR